VTVASDVSDDDFRGWLFAADAIVDLRYPHRGEVSGSLARAMQAGRAAVVSATGTYLDIPDEMVLRISPGPADPDELAVALRRLVDDPELRVRMGEAARAHIAERAASDATARGYAHAIEQTLGLVRDPVRVAASRWGGSLVDLGIDDDMVREGYGVSYMQAFEDFTRSS
jgi:glycosyltransferase involved in cell wall biosynthesis